MMPYFHTHTNAQSRSMKNIREYEDRGLSVILWAGAGIVLAFSEAIALYNQIHRAQWALSSPMFWRVPVLICLPLSTGFNFYRRVSKLIGDEAATSVGMLGMWSFYLAALTLIANGTTLLCLLACLSEH